MKTLALLLAGALLAGCSSESSSPPADPNAAAFQQIITAWVDALDASDAAAMAALFTPDGTITYPDARAPSVGRTAVESAVAALLGVEQAVGSAITAPAWEVHGDWAQLLSDFRTTWTAGASTSPEHSRYIWTLQKQGNGTWLIARFTFYPLP